MNPLNRVKTTIWKPCDYVFDFMNEREKNIIIIIMDFFDDIQQITTQQIIWFQSSNRPGVHFPKA